MRHTALRLVLPMLLVLAACKPDAIEAPLQEAPDLPTVELRSIGDITPLDGREPLSRAAIDRLVQIELHQNGEFRWDAVDDYVLWSAIIQSDSLVSIGYQPEGFENLWEVIHEIDVKDPQWASVKRTLIDFILERLAADTGVRVDEEDILAFGDKPLPYFNVFLHDYETLAMLRHFSVVRYVEPMGFGTELPDDLRSGSGCGNSAAGFVPTSDYTTVSPGAKASWHFYEHNIPAAWGQSQGDNVAVGLIDTGIADAQSKLNGSFASGQSTGRFRQKYSFYEECFLWWCSNDGPNDQCGHGTNMAGLIAAPRTSGGATVGAAYKSNLVSVRATDDVIINGSGEKDGVSDAYYYLGNRNDIKIISMSLGDVFYSGQVADAVVYAHNKGKLIFNAAGTSLSWTSWWGVIFPANMSQTVAVTGVRTGNNLQRCNTCHDGSQVDFVITMQDAGNTNRTALTLHTNGNQPAYTSGSSAATATMAGIAALVWGKNLGQNRTQVLQRLKDASQFYPSRNNNFGWGRVDALQAVNAVP